MVYTGDMHRVRSLLSQQVCVGVGGGGGRKGERKREIYIPVLTPVPHTSRLSRAHTYTHTHPRIVLVHALGRISLTRSSGRCKPSRRVVEPEEWRGRGGDRRETESATFLASFFFSVMTLSARPPLPAVG